MAMDMDMEGQSPTAEQACFEKSDDLAGRFTGSTEAPKTSNIQFERPGLDAVRFRRHPANESRGAG